MHRIILCSFWLILGLLGPSGAVGAPAKLASGLSSWAETQKQVAITQIFANISKPDMAPGAVVASPSRANPDYYYHWVRDAALTMDSLVSLYEISGSAPELQNALIHWIIHYVSFSRQNQQAQTLTGLGEPKFYVDGRPYGLAWGRPQNDGPALRAITLIHLANVLIREGEIEYVRRALYDGLFPSASVIKTDLEYVSQHWRDSSFDLWEEVRADHFYTHMVQRRALVEGAMLATVLGDQGAASWYATQARALEQDLKRFVRTDLQWIYPSLNFQEGVDYKASQLDIAVLLGVLHGDAGDGFFPASHPLVLRTAERLSQAFSQLYAVNDSKSGAPGVAIGRYPEDRYSGNGFTGGNPWILATAAMGEIYYRAAHELRSLDPVLAESLRKRAEQYLLRLQYHSNADGSMAEQWDRNTGYMTSAHDLTWSYVSFLTLMASREGWAF